MAVELPVALDEPEPEDDTDELAVSLLDAVDESVSLVVAEPDEELDADADELPDGVAEID